MTEMKPLNGSDLKRFVKQYRRKNRPQRRIILLLQSIAYPANVGSIFRMADGAGVEEVILTGITPVPPQPTIDKVSRMKYKSVPWRYEEDAAVVLDQLRADGYETVAVELTDDSVVYTDFDYSDKLCLVVGHEDHGVTKATLAACDDAVFIPMFGKGLSLNVHVALSIVTYHALLAPPIE